MGKLQLSDAVKACLIGQVLSFLLTVTGTTSEVLASAGINAPTTQSFFNYCLLAVTCGAIHCWRSSGFQKLSNPWYIYAGLALLDVEGNYLVVSAYQYTSITSVTLLDSATIPMVMVLSVLVFRSRYLVGHILGAGLCTAGLAILVLTDSSSETGGSNPLLGDALVLGGACVYAICNIAQEKLLSEDTSRWELLAMLGLFASLISGCQAALLERGAWVSPAWNLPTIAAMGGFSLSLWMFYVLVPSVLLLGSSAILNLSLLTSDLMAAVSRVILFGGFGGTAWAFAVALAAEVAGISLYAWCGETHHHATGSSGGPLSSTGGSHLGGSYEQPLQQKNGFGLLVSLLHTAVSGAPHSGTPGPKHGVPDYEQTSLLAHEDFISSGSTDSEQHISLVPSLGMATPPKRAAQDVHHRREVQQAPSQGVHRGKQAESTAVLPERQGLLSWEEEESELPR